MKNLKIVQYGPDLNDMWYPPWEIERLIALGVDVTGYKVANLGPDRGLTAHNRAEWDFIMPDGRIAYPWTVHAGFSEEEEADIAAAIDQLEKDIGCFDFIHVPRSEAANPPFQHGVMFVPGALTGGGSYTMMGKVPGFSGVLGKGMPFYGGSKDWMMISLEDWYDRGRTVQHEGPDIICNHFCFSFKNFKFPFFLR